MAALIFVDTATLHELNSVHVYLVSGLPSKATEMPLIFPCWTKTVNLFFKSASPETRPAPWHETLAEAILVVDVLTCGRAKSINKNVEYCKTNCCAIVVFIKHTTTTTAAATTTTTTG